MLLRQTLMLTIEPTTISIYDIVDHRTFTVNRRDIDVKRSKVVGRPEEVFDAKTGKAFVQAYLYVRPWARKKVPGGEYFVVSATTWRKFTQTPRSEW